MVSPEEMAKMGIQMRHSKDITLEDEYAKMKDTVDIDNWEQVRGPRPWEETDQKEWFLADRRVWFLVKWWPFGQLIVDYWWIAVRYEALASKNQSIVER